MADPAVFRPEDIANGDVREDLKKAVVAAYMATNLIGEAQSDNSIDSWSSLERDGDGLRFNYNATILGEDYDVYCLYPSGDWHLNVPFGPDVGDWPGFTAITCTNRWDDIGTDINTWLDSWIGCPDPNAFQNQINSMARIASQMNIGSDVGGSAPAGGDTDLSEAVKTVENRAYGEGRTMVAFRDAYSSDLRTTVNNQCGMTAAAGIAMTSEGAAWSATYKSMRDLVKVSINDFYSLAGNNADDGGAAALGATAAVAGLLGATVGVAFPPFGVAMGGVSAVIGVYTVMHPAVPESDTTPLELSGGDYYAMWTSFQDKTRAVSADLGKAEQAIADGCRRVIADTSLNPESYSLTNGGSSGPRQYDDLNGVLTKVLDVQTSSLREMSGAAELIGNQQTTLGSFVVGTDGAGSSSSVVRFEWYRGTLPDGTRIGMDGGYGDGPFEAYSDLVDTIAATLKAEGNNSRRVADSLMKMALEFDLKDDLSAQQNQTLQQAISTAEAPQDHNPIYRGNDPSDPWYSQIP